MGLFNLSRVRSALFPVAALITLTSLLAPIAYAGGPISVDVAAGTTTYSVTSRTINTPLNTTVSVARDITPYVSKVPNGLAQSAAGDLIVATKQGSLNAPFTGKFLVQTPTLKAAAKTFLRSAGYAGTAIMVYDGLQSVLNANGWYINWSTNEVMQFTPVESWHPGLVQFNDQHPINNSRFNFPFPLRFSSNYGFSYNLPFILESLGCVAQGSSTCRLPTPASITGDTEAIDYATSKVLPILGPFMDDKVIACSALTPNPLYQSCYIANSHTQLDLIPYAWRNPGYVEVHFSAIAYPSHITMTDYSTGQNVEFSPYGVTRNNYNVGYAPTELGGESLVTPTQFDNAIDSQYEPSPSEWDAFFNEPDFAPDSFILDPIASVSTEPVVSTSTDTVTGNTSVTSNGTQLSFTVINPPSGIPEVTVNEIVKDKEYLNGDLVKDNTTETVKPPVSGTNRPPASGGSTSSGSGSGSGSGAGVDFPIFCTWAATVCDFIDWFKDDYVGDNPDLSSIMKDDDDYIRSKTISFGSASCPAPHTIYISSLGMSVDLSFDFFCQFAIYAKALVLAAAYIFAAYISLGVARG